MKMLEGQLRKKINVERSESNCLKQNPLEILRRSPMSQREEQKDSYCGA